MNLKKKINNYIDKWKSQGYDLDIPDEVCYVLMKNNLAPSYKSIAWCILNNDLYLTKLGMKVPKSKWYSYLKRKELKEKGKI